MKKFSFILLLFCVIKFQSQVIITAAGNHAPGYLGDGVPAISTQLNSPNGVAADANGNFYIADVSNHRVRKVNSAGIISTFAGNGVPGFSGDGGPAISAQLDNPNAIAVDDTGNVYIVDQFNRRVRKVRPDGIISTFAGDGSFNLVDGVSATASGLNFPNGLAVDTKGNIYISDFGDARVRKINSSGIITTFAGNGNYMNGFTSNGGPADTTEIGQPSAVACDAVGNVYIADGNSLIRKVDTMGIIWTAAGLGNSFGAISGDGGPALQALLGAPSGITFDKDGNMYISDYFNHVIRIVDTLGIINTHVSFVANGGGGYSGDYGPANAAKLFMPTGIATDNQGDLYIADRGNDVVRKVGKCIPAIPEICVVAVDSLSKNNVIYWDKSLYSADTFYIYRDTANNNYALIGKVPYDSMGLFVDTVRTLYAANGDPNASSWRYKITYGFPCVSGRNISPMSPWHQTLFMINSGSSFIWTMYQVEGQPLPVPGLQNYLFKRDNLSNGNWNVIQALSASSAAYTDQSYNQYQFTASWRVETYWDITCDPTRGIINTSRSNVRGMAALNIGMSETIYDSDLILFPVPMNESQKLFVELNKSKIKQIEISDIAGRTMLNNNFTEGSNSVSLDLSILNSGIYFVKVGFGKDQFINRRILKN